MSARPPLRAGPCRTILLALALSLAIPAAADAVVSDVEVIDGPSSAIQTDAVDAAMSEDGTGGIVYLKTVDGRDHVFAAQYRDGAWGAPQRVDVGQGFDSSWPRIGAGVDGRLLVTWVQEFGVDSDRMFSATLDPGTRSFQSPVTVDFDLNEATATFPDLAMARGGQAYLVYDVVTDVSPSNPSGYEGVDVRVARYSNRLWTLFGSPIDRNSSIPMRIPTSANAPRVGVDVQGQAVVAWQEPDDEFVDRIWARRLFDTRVGIPLIVSPQTWDGLPLRGNADAFALDVAGFGQAAVALRQQPGQASALSAPRIFVNEIPEMFVEGANRFGEPILADGGVRGGLGPPGVGVEPSGGFVAGFGSGSATVLSQGDAFSVNASDRVDSGASSAEPLPLVDFAATGAAVAAWRELRGAAGAVGAQERRADGVVESTTLTTSRGGVVSEIALGGSGRGDAVVVWSQGTGSGAQVATSVVDAPPDPFLALLPSGWENQRRVPVSWQPAANAGGPVTYSVSVDDEPVDDGVKGQRTKLSPDDIEDGIHRIQVFAQDRLGQETGSNRAKLRVDRTPPAVKLRRSGKRLRVVVTDGRKAAGSGLRGRAKVSFGDGAHASARARKGAPTSLAHRYKRRGVFRVSVTARDRAHNSATVRRKVKIG